MPSEKDKCQRTIAQLVEQGKEGVVFNLCMLGGLTFDELAVAETSGAADDVDRSCSTN